MLCPETEADLASAVAEAAGQGRSLRIAGGGSQGAVGPPIATEAVLSTAALTGIVHYDPGALHVVVRAGTPLAELEETLSANGQMLAFDPMDLRPLSGAGGTPTVGGMVAANLSGPRRVLSGACRDHLLGVRFVTGEGTIILNGGRVMKNVTGLDLTRLVCGAYGTLGVLTEVALKTLPRPETARTLALPGLAPGDAVDLFCTALGMPCETSGAAWEGGTAYLRLEGLGLQVANRTRLLKDRFAGYGIDLIDGADHDRLWRRIRDVEPFAGRPGAVWRVSVPPTAASAVVDQAVSEAGAEALIDWGGGRIWLLVPEDLPDPAGVLRAGLGQGAHATLVRGSDALRRRVPVFHPQPAPLARIAADLRKRFDPAGILNPGLMTG